MTTFKEFLAESTHVKLKWAADPAPTGRYRSFDRRGWPSAEYAGTDKAAAALYCDDEYRPSDVKAGTHAPITIRIADWTSREKDPNAAAFVWRKLKDTAKTLPEAKALALKVINANPQLLPKELRPKSDTVKEDIADGDAVDSDVKVQKQGDDFYKISVDATAGPAIVLLRKVLHQMSKTKTVFELKSKSGGKLDMLSFKSNGFLVKPRKEEDIKRVIDAAVAAFTREQRAKAKFKETEPQRKKNAAMLSAAAQKERMSDMDAKYGKGTYGRVKIKQIGGDDGYQYNVIVDGRSVLNGLTKREADHYANSERDKIAKKEKLGKYSE